MEKYNFKNSFSNKKSSTEKNMSIPNPGIRPK